jgi:hypothetical protein
LTDDEAIEKADSTVRKQAEIDDMIEDIIIAHAEGVISVPQLNGVKSHTAKVRVFEQKFDITDIEHLHEDVQKAYDERIKAEDEQILAEQTRDAFRIDPDDPNYNPMVDRKRREAIEADLKPLDFAEMLFKGYTSQRIQIREGFSITLRTLPTQHGLWLEALMAREPETSPQHTRHTFSLMQLAASLDEVHAGGDRQVTGPSLVKYLKDDKASFEGFEKALKERMEFIGRFPTAVTDDLIVQNVWFSGRVRRVLAGDLMRKVGNS